MEDSCHGGERRPRTKSNPCKKFGQIVSRNRLHGQRATHLLPMQRKAYHEENRRRQQAFFHCLTPIVREKIQPDSDEQRREACQSFLGLGQCAVPW